MSTDPEQVDRPDPVLAAVHTWRARVGDVSAHPSSDLLLAYHGRELVEVEAEALREHLALCPECAQRALDLASLSGRAARDGDAESPAVAPMARPLEAAEAWEDTRRALAAEGLFHASHAAPPEAESRFSRSSLFGPRLAYAAAAVLLLTSVGLSLRLADAGRNLAELERARANVVLVDLHPLAASAPRADDLPPPEVAIAAGEDLVLILHLLDPGTYDRYRAEAFDAQRRTLWSTDALRRSPEGDFTLLLPRRQLAAGRYLIRLHGLEGERADLLAEYHLRFVAPAR